MRGALAEMSILRPASISSGARAVRIAFGLCLVWLWLTPGQVGAQEAVTAGELETQTTPSPRNANYTIEVRLDAEAKTLEGRQTVVWRNTRSAATAELWFHLYWNGWRNSHSTWMLEDRIRGRSSLDAEEEPEDWGYLEVDSVRLSSAARATTSR